MTNDNLLKKGIEQLEILEEDLENVGAEDYHQLMRAWELKHRAVTVSYTHLTLPTILLV